MQITRAIRHLLVALVTTSSPATLLAADSPDVTIAEVCFATGVSDRQPVNASPPDGTVRGKRLYCWVRLTGGQEALDLLKEKGRLPLYHIWLEKDLFRFNNLETADPTQESFVTRIFDTLTKPFRSTEKPAFEGAVIEPQDPANAQSIEVGNLRGLDALQEEVNTRDCFDWRLWSYLRRSLHPDRTYVVQIVDATGKPLQMADATYRFFIHYENP